MFSIREGNATEVEGFQLWNEDNEGNMILVAENEQGEVVAFAQMTGCTIFFLESVEKGAGRALVEYLQEDFDHLIADHTDQISAGFWQRMGFQRMQASMFVSGDNFEWWAE